MLILCVSEPVYAEAYGSGWYGELQASYGHEDNISRTYKSDEVDDRIASISVGGGYSAKLGDNAQVILSSYITYNQHDEYEDLDNYAVSLGVDYTVQPNVAYDSVWYKVSVNAANLEYENSDAREGVFVNGTLYDADGNVTGTPDTELIASLAPKGHVWINRNGLADLFGVMWDGEALLSVNASDDLRLLNLNFANSETFFNFSCYESFVSQ